MKNEKTPAITYKEFKKYIEILEDFENLQDGISDLVRKFNRSKNENFVELQFPSMACVVIDLLEKFFNDESEWISYWIFELEFGKKYKDGCVTFNDEIVKLKTVEDLWNLLTSK